MESLLDYPSAAELATAKATLQAAATRSGWTHGECCFAENATAVQGDDPANHWRETELLDENVFLSGGLRSIIAPAKVVTVLKQFNMEAELKLDTADKAKAPEDLLAGFKDAMQSFNPARAAERDRPNRF